MELVGTDHRGVLAFRVALDEAAIMACDELHLPMSMAFVVEQLCKHSWAEVQAWANPVPPTATVHRTIKVAASKFSPTPALAHLAKVKGDDLVFRTRTSQETEAVLMSFPWELPYSIN